MKKIPAIVFTLLLPVLFFNAHGQQQFTQVASRENSYCNSTCTLLDVPELNKNTTAVVLATPVIENGINIDPHPIGVHFINQKWSIINLDGAAMPTGSKFNVQYFSKPDPGSQFVHTVTKENLKDNNIRSFINHPGLNNNPKAQMQFIASGIGTGNNRYEVSIQYDDAAGQWYISNVNKKPLDYNVSYNIVIASGERATTQSAAVAVPQLISQPAAVTVYGNIQLVLMSVDGALQGHFKGDGTTATQVTKIGLTAFTLENTLPRDLATGQASGKIQRHSVIINKLFGGSSVQFSQAFLKNELLKTVIVEFYETSSGSPKLSYTIKLTNARVSNIKQAINTEAEQKGLREEIQLVYQKMEMTDASGYIAIDDVTANNP